MTTTTHLKEHAIDLSTQWPLSISSSTDNRETMMRIPKIVHYCWFGRGSMPDLALRCVESWKTHLPEYKFMLWNEDTFDVTQHLYVQQAYKAKKYAFVTDYVRLYAMYTVGGVYMDTDVEILKPLDQFLSHPVFSGFESQRDVPTGLWAAEAKHPLIKELLEGYRERAFVLADGRMDLTPNVATTTRLLASRGLRRNNSYQDVCGFYIYPHEYFCAKCRLTGEITITDNTHAIHHFAGSWWQPTFRGRVFRMLFEKPLVAICGKAAYVRVFEAAKAVDRVWARRNT